MKRETPLGLYKGLGAVVTGIVPKMAIRFTSYEWYKQLLASEDGTVSGEATFFGKETSCDTVRESGLIRFFFQLDSAPV